ncbi:uncharacterized protein DUF4376 [Novosphingobium sp. PhB165]|uniref:DUF4376 domain-containing protein n=1 Tax=Novosphingobium sp. PhB165 TaxID=2485105 RepID=UPI00104342A5|nr:DUF4376 domain-containing protein [Novosphingobium sp. PhB165]TCM17198.1 uncharacterized protein DUF4376 [Novosphingobium sp. PhB165]
MYIFTTDADDVPTIYDIGSVTLGDDDTTTTVAVATRGIAGVTIAPIGMGSDSFVNWTSINLPPDAVPRDQLSLLSVVQWLASDAGPYAGGKIVSKTDFPLACQQATLRYFARLQRNAVQAGGCTVQIGEETKRIDTDLASRVNLVGAVALATMTTSDFSMDWRLSDNSIVTLDAATMVAVGSTVARFISAAQLRKNAIDAEVDARTEAMSDEEFAAAKAGIAEGWPS